MSCLFRAHVAPVFVVAFFRARLPLYGDLSVPAVYAHVNVFFVIHLVISISPQHSFIEKPRLTTTSGLGEGLDSSVEKGILIVSGSFFLLGFSITVAPSFRNSKNLGSFLLY